MKKEKHNHKLTNLLKVCIFGVIMIAPFIAVLSKALYVTFNKNAQDSYSDEYIQRNNKVNNDTLLLENYQYTITNINVSASTYATYQYNFYTCNINFETVIPSTVGHTIVGFGFRGNSNGNKFIYAFDENGTWYEEHSGASSFYKNLLPIVFTLKSYQTAPILGSNNFNTYDIYQMITITNKLDNVFYYAIDELQEQPIFNWAKDTGIYNALNSFTTGITGTTNNTLALLLSYWFIITAIYIVIDIIIFAFTYLTHFFNN